MSTQKVYRRSLNPKGIGAARAFIAKVAEFRWQDRLGFVGRGGQVAGCTTSRCGFVAGHLCPLGTLKLGKTEKEAKSEEQSILANWN